MLCSGVNRSVAEIVIYSGMKFTTQSKLMPLLKIYRDAHFCYRIITCRFFFLCLVVSNIGYKKSPVSRPAPVIIKIFEVTEWIYG